MRQHLRKFIIELAKVGQEHRTAEPPGDLRQLRKRLRALLELDVRAGGCKRKQAAQPRRVRAICDDWNAKDEITPRLAARRPSDAHPGACRREGWQASP